VRAARDLALAALVLAGFLAAPGGAAGQGVSFVVPASHGYSMRVSGFGATAVVFVNKPGGRRHRAWSAYVARGEVSPTSLRASFGDLGKVEVRFRAAGPVSYSKRGRGCRGADRYTIHAGVFVGTVRFRGEGGYTASDVHRVRGRAVTPASLHCRRPPRFPARSHVPRRIGVGPGKTTRLSAWYHTGPSALYFEGLLHAGVAHYFAVRMKSADQVAVYRSVYAAGPAATFSFDSALTHASVSPPAPFGGTGTFRHGADGSRSWTGPLSVSFPGEPSVPLTGSVFKLTLSRSL
jgi:hypothetical protein